MLTARGKGEEPRQQQRRQQRTPPTAKTRVSEFFREMFLRSSTVFSLAARAGALMVRTAFLRCMLYAFVESGGCYRRCWSRAFFQLHVNLKHQDRRVSSALWGSWDVAVWLWCLGRSRLCVLYVPLYGLAWACVWQSRWLHILPATAFYWDLSHSLVLLSPSPPSLFPSRRGDSSCFSFFRPACFSWLCGRLWPTPASLSACL